MRAQRLHARERRQLVAAEIVRRLGEERLAAVARGEQARHTVERGAEVVARTQLDRARMERHADAQLRGFRPRLALKRPLRLERRGKCVGRRMERRAEGVATVLKT